MSDFILKRSGKPDIAYTFDQGTKDITVLYLHGWGANRKRPKALAVQETAQKMGCSYLSLDYTAHGDSGGESHLFTVGQGIEDTLDVLQKTSQNKPLIIIGNSIGGWIGLWLSEKLEQTIAFIGLAPAPDITEMVWNKMLPPYARAELEKGNILGPSPETFGLCLTKKLFQDGLEHSLLNRDIRFKGPVRILLGDKDDRVDWKRVIEIKDRLISDNVDITLIKGADHHLSAPKDLKAIQTTLQNLIREILS